MTEDGTFGDDPVDALSVAKRTSLSPGGLATLVDVPVRNAPDKPGRSVQVMWDDRSPFVPGFENTYSYTVTFSAKGNAAGNHFHKLKNEIFVPLAGSMRIVLADIDSRSREEFSLGAGDNRIACVRAGIAHTVVAETDVAILFVLADHPNLQADESLYTLV